MTKVSAEVIDSLRAKIDGTTSSPDGIPGLVFVAVTPDGETIFEHSSGKAGVGKQEPMTMDSVFWIASCTKMITGIACMQLVEQGKLALDDADMLEKISPELEAVKVLDENGRLVDKKRRITLRMLLSHTGVQQLYDFRIGAHTDLDHPCSWVRIFILQPEAPRSLRRKRLGRAQWCARGIPVAAPGQPTW